MLNTLIHWSKEHHMVIHDKIHLQSPVATVGNCTEMDVVKDCGVERTCVKGQVLLWLRWKPSSFPAKKGGGSEPGPNPVALCSAATCLFCGELLELHWSSAGALSLCRNAHW